MRSDSSANTAVAASCSRRGTACSAGDRVTAQPTETVPQSGATPALRSLLRKAAVDAGFDLEPEFDGAWWRLRASGVPGIAWVYPESASGGALLALPLAEQLAEVGAAGGATVEGGTAPALPPGAAGAVACATPTALHAALRRVISLRAHAPERLLARWEAGVIAALGPLAAGPAGGPAVAPVATEVVAEVRRRVGQDLYRQALLDFWEGRCAVTGLAFAELLRASHAKPWAEATDAERLDVHNGLLLAVHLDALFDRGFLTFDETGAGVFSSALTTDDRARLGLSEAKPRLRRVHPDHLPYLTWHRSHVFRP
jgi:putative restriction endonuclease